ncbi:MAG: prephenate dehydrogenase/arogenate dehydrogenase family protein, partial [Oscillospiraceae bacterium]
MKIAVIGLGLIGGSLCKTIKKYTNHECFGYDTNEKVLAEALSQSAIDDVCVDFSAADLTIVCLYPQATIDFILKNSKNFKKDSLVIDTCGIKSAIIQAVEQPLSTNSVEFIGCHPMAGR